MNIAQQKYCRSERFHKPKTATFAKPSMYHFFLEADFRNESLFLSRNSSRVAPKLSQYATKPAQKSEKADDLSQFINCVALRRKKKQPTQFLPIFSSEQTQYSDLYNAI